MASLKPQKPFTTPTAAQVKKDPVKLTGTPAPASKPGSKKPEQKPREPKKVLSGSIFEHQLS